MAGQSEDEEAADLKGESPTGCLGNAWKPQENEGICCKMWTGLQSTPPPVAVREPHSAPTPTPQGSHCPSAKAQSGMRLLHSLLYLSMQRPWLAASSAMGISQNDPTRYRGSL